MTLRIVGRGPCDQCGRRWFSHARADASDTCPRCVAEQATKQTQISRQR